MNNRHIKKVFLSALLLFTLSLTTIYVDASQNNGNSTDEELENVQGQIEDAEDKIDEYNDQKDALQNDINDLNANLQSLANDINSIESQIADKQADIQQLSTELDVATKLAKAQQEAMMTRIQFMYEQGNTSLLVTLLESNSFSDFLKRAEYISYITSYDKAKLEEYEQKCANYIREKKSGQMDEKEIEQYLYRKGYKQ